MTNVRRTGRPRNPVPEVGAVIGRLTVVSNTETKPGHGQSLLRVRCECGTEKTVTAANVRAGKTTSCGCLTRERAVVALTTHGQATAGAATPEYKTWCKMISRCTNPSTKDAPRYGGRGITVCDRWRHDFAAFFADMGPKPGPGYSIDRFPNSNGNYEPGNCRWATAKQQSLNRGNFNHMIDFEGRQMTVSEACELAGLSVDAVLERLKAGWTADRALHTSTTESRVKRFVEFRGQTMSLADACAIAGLPVSTVTSRERMGWTIDRALNTPARSYHRSQ